MKLTTAWVLALGIALSATAGMAEETAPEQEQQTLTKTETRFDLMKCPLETVDAFKKAVSDVWDTSNFSSDANETIMRMALFGLARMANNNAQKMIDDASVGGLSEQQAFEKMFCPMVEDLSAFLVEATRTKNQNPAPRTP